MLTLGADDRSTAIFGLGRLGTWEAVMRSIVTKKSIKRAKRAMNKVRVVVAS